jgi:hypothetical protein
MQSSIHVLHLEDDPADAELVQAHAIGSRFGLPHRPDPDAR